MVVSDYREELYSCVSTEGRGLLWRSVFEYVFCFPQSNNGMRNDTKRILVGLRSVFVQSSYLVIIVAFCSPVIYRRLGVVFLWL